MLLVERFGSPNKMALAVKLSYVLVRGLKEGKALTANYAERIEQSLGLPDGWMSVPHPEGINGAGKVEKLAGELEDNSDERQSTRRANIYLLIGEGHGAKARFSKVMKWHATEITHLETRTFGHRKARGVEAHLGLPAGWLDNPQEVDQVPPDVRAFIEGRSTGPHPDEPSEAAAFAPGLMPGAGGPVARALLETLVSQINRGALTEKRAHEMLGKLLEPGE